MMNINYKLLKEDLNFPLVLDEYSSYVWTEDDGLQMVAQFEDKYRYKIPTELIVFESNLEGEYTLDKGEFFKNECVRGLTVIYNDQEWTIVEPRLNNVLIERDGIRKIVTVHNLKEYVYNI